MADDSSGPAGAVKEPLTPAMTRLLEAESQADEIVRRAQNEADEIMLTAKRRARGSFPNSRSLSITKD